jgi:hypothetical protein
MALRFRGLDKDHFIEAQVSVNPASIAANTDGSVDVSVPGITSSHRIMGAPVGAALVGGLTLQGFSVPATGTLRIHLRNNTAGALDGAAGNWAIFAFLGR